MSEEAFEEMRREMERARRDFQEAMGRIRAELQQGSEQAWDRLEEERERLERRMLDAGRRFQASRKGPHWRGLGGSKRRDPPGRGGGPQPAPVRPVSPSNLSGGAEAPLDQ